MASYTNLSSLSSLKKGDVVTYNTSTEIDFAGTTVSVKLYGKIGNTQSDLASGYKYIDYYAGDGDKYPSSVYIPKGGLTQFTLDTKNLRDKFYFRRGMGVCLNYQGTDEYHRIAVAGNGGSTGVIPTNSAFHKVLYSVSTGSGYGAGDGGGSQGESGTYYTGIAAAGGGTELTGGWAGEYTESSSYYSGRSGNAGTFGAGGDPYSGSFTFNGVKYGPIGTGFGGDGWFGGGSGAVRQGVQDDYGTTPADNCIKLWLTTGAGGSGFVMSNYAYSTSTTSLSRTVVDEIKNSMTDASLIQGGSNSINSGTMVITIEKTAEPETIKYYDGSTFKDVSVNYYTGSSFKQCTVKYYNGSAWKDIGG